MYVANAAVAAKQAVTAKPGTVNQGPYAQDRVANVKLSNWNAAIANLKTGDHASFNLFEK